MRENDGRYSGKGGVFESVAPTDEAANDPARPMKSVEGWILVVTGLHEETIEDNLYEKFETYGTISNVHLNLDRRTGYVKGYALIEFEKYAEAKSAIEGVSNQEICGKRVKVDWAFVRQD